MNVCLNSLHHTCAISQIVEETRIFKTDDQIKTDFVIYIFEAAVNNNICIFTLLQIDW